MGPTSYARELCQVVDNHFTSVYVIIYKWHPFTRPFAAQDGYPGEAQTSRSEHLLGAIRPELGLLLLHGDELGVDSNQCARVRQLVWTQGFVLDEFVVPGSVGYVNIIQRSNKS